MDRTHRLTKQSAICEICGLTVPNKEELEDHVNHAHKRGENANYRKGGRNKIEGLTLKQEQ
jgi:hypothetical protein